MGREAGSRREAVREAAAEWAVRLSDPACAKGERAAFEAWRAESFEHEAAFERAQAAWERADRLRAFRPANDRPDADLLAPQRQDVEVRRLFDRRSPWTLAAAAVALLGVAAAGLTSVTASTAYATAIGERRVVVLADNSRIELNTDSKVLVRYRSGVREVKLVKGEALFEATHEARPFVVRAHDARIATSGGELSVRLGAENAAVTVRRGAADVEADGRGGPAGETRLAAGRAMVYGPAGVRAQALTDAEIDRALAWRQGAIALNGQSLTQAVAEFNRYNRRKVRIADPSIADLRLAGYFQSTEPTAFVAAVTNAFPVRASQGEDGAIRLARRD